MPPSTTTPITLSIQNFAEMAVRVVIFRFGSAEPMSDVELERGGERLFPALKLPRGTYFVVVAAADASARLVRLDLPWSDRSDRPSSTPGALFELIVVPVLARPTELP